MMRFQRVKFIHFFACFLFTIIAIGSANGADPVKSDIQKIAVVVHGYQNNAIDEKYNEQIVQIIVAKLVRHNFDVINTHAFPEIDELVTKDFSFKDNKNLCSTYGTDVILVVSPELLFQNDEDTVCRVQMSIRGWGYDIKGNDLGISFNKQWLCTDRNCKAAFFKISKELGNLAGHEFAMALDPVLNRPHRSKSLDKGYN